MAKILKLPSRYCVFCMKDVLLRKDGTLRTHQRNGQPCPGSQQRPVVPVVPGRKA